eukprot:g360.t1
MESDQKVIIDPSAFVCESVNFEGTYDIHIGPGCVLEPQSCIQAIAGPIHIGPNNLLRELVTISNVTLDERQEISKEKKTTDVLRLGRGNLFDVASQVKGTNLTIGDGNHFEMRSSLHVCDFEWKNKCVIAMGSKLNLNILTTLLHSTKNTETETEKKKGQLVTRDKDIYFSVRGEMMKEPILDFEDENFPMKLEAQLVLARSTLPNFHKRHSDSITKTDKAE